MADYSSSSSINVVSESWDLLELLARVRCKLEKSDAAWEDFEYLTILSREWMQTRGTTSRETDDANLTL